MKLSKEISTAIFVFIACIILYLITLCPTVYLGDSGEYTASAYTLGISHPPGYPLYSILGKLFTFIPVGSIAARVNFMSAFFAALTAAIVCLITFRLTRNIYASACSGLMLAFSATFWSQAVTAEVYTLNAFFAAFILLIFLKWKNNKVERYLYLFAFIYGISLSNHYIMFLFAPAYIAFIALNIDKLPVKNYLRISVIMMLFLFLGLAVYLYLPLRSVANPPVDWGNPETLRGIMNHLKRIQYKEFEFGKVYGLGNNIRFAGQFMKDALTQFTFISGLLSIVGIWFLAKKKEYSILLFTGLVFILNSFLLILILNLQFTALGKAIFEVYYLPAFMSVVIWAGYGISELSAKLSAQGSRRINVSAILLLIPLMLLLGNFRENNRNSYYIAYDYGMNILNTMEEDSNYITYGDNQIFTLAYLQMVEKKRPDIRIFNEDGIIFPFPYGEKYLAMSKQDRAAIKKTITRELIEISERPVYFSIRIAERELDGNYIPSGLLARGLKTGGSKGYRDYWKEYRFRGEPGEDFRTKDYWTKDICSEYYFNMGKWYLMRGEKEKAVDIFIKAAKIGYDIDWLHNNLSSVFHGKLGMLDKAEEAALTAIKLNNLFASPHNELGIVYYMKGNIKEALEEFEKALELDPNLPEANYNYKALKNAISGKK